jgi:hypothetical protein
MSTVLFGLLHQLDEAIRASHECLSLNETPYEGWVKEELLRLRRELVRHLLRSRLASGDCARARWPMTPRSFRQ